MIKKTIIEQALWYDAQSSNCGQTKQLLTSYEHNEANNGSVNAEACQLD